MKKILAVLLLAIPLYASGIRGPITVREKVEKNPGPTVGTILYSLGNLYEYIDSAFLFDIDMDKMLEDLVSAMLSSLDDPYTYFIPEEDSEDFLEFNEGQYVGLGLYLSKKDPSKADPSDPESFMIKIESPFPGGPADRAGLRSGDMISKINGESVAPLTSVEASKALRGTEGVPETVTVLRGNSSFEIILTPEVVIMPSSLSGMLGDIGYILIGNFSLTTSESVKSDIETLLSSGARGIIIDLRNNGGGSVNAAEKIADMFLSSGVIVSTELKVSGTVSVIEANPSTTIVPEDIPVALLVNGGTASSSEILSAALKDNNRAVIIGSKTFGKGIVQDVRGFGKGLVQMTVGRFYTPSGENIHEVGIEPDILIEEPEYSDDELSAYSEFVKSGSVSAFVDSNEQYSHENIEKFIETYRESGVSEDLLSLLVRKEYMYRLDYSERPVADPEYDKALKTAIEVLSV